MSDQFFTPTFNAIIEPHPHDIPKGALSPERQITTLEAETQTPPQKEGNSELDGIQQCMQAPIKQGDAATRDCCTPRKIEFDPMFEEAYHADKLFYALGASFMMGALIGTLLTCAFSRREVCEA